MSLFKPDQASLRLGLVDFDGLVAMGVRLLMIDIDNTLVPWEEDVVSADTRILLGRLAGRFELLLVSNRTAGRAGLISIDAVLPCIAPAMKPLPFRMLRAVRQRGVRPAEAALIGDQLLTDVLAARLGGFRSVLVEPFTNREFVGTKVSRFIERTFLGRRSGVSADA